MEDRPDRHTTAVVITPYVGHIYHKKEKLKASVLVAEHSVRCEVYLFAARYIKPPVAVCPQRSHPGELCVIWTALHIIEDRGTC